MQVPYIAEAMLNTTGKNASDYYNVTGILIYDPILGDRTLGDNAPVIEFVNANKNLYVPTTLDTHSSCPVSPLSYKVH